MKKVKIANSSSTGQHNKDPKTDECLVLGGKFLVRGRLKVDWPLYLLLVVTLMLEVTLSSATKPIWLMALLCLDQGTIMID